MTASLPRDAPRSARSSPAAPRTTPRFTKRKVHLAPTRCTRGDTMKSASIDDGIVTARRAEIGEIVARRAADDAALYEAESASCTDTLYARRHDEECID